MRTRTLRAGTISLCLAALLGSVGSAQAQAQLAPFLQHRAEKLGGLTVPALPALEPRFISPTVPTQPDLASSDRQLTMKADLPSGPPHVDWGRHRRRGRSAARKGGARQIRERSCQWRRRPRYSVDSRCCGGGIHWIEHMPVTAV